MTLPETLLDLLDHGCDGEPRCAALDAADADEAAALVRLVAAEAERRGYVPLGAGRFAVLAAALPDEMRDRTFVLLETCGERAAAGRAALVAAATVNARPHLLITVAIRGSRSAGDSRSAARVPPARYAPRTSDSGPRIAREARTAYAAVRPVPVTPPAESERYLRRAEEARVLARAGRHEPAVRMLREIAAALARRRDAAGAARAAMVLGRVLLERGRADAADRAFGDAAAALERVLPAEAAIARVWMALARTDAGRLTEAEAMLRATRLAGRLPGRLTQAWADAALGRCLLWQGRVADALAAIDREPAWETDADPFFVGPVLATHARVLLAAGRTFDAGQRARAAVERADQASDPLLRLAAATAHLHVLAEAGDVDLVRARVERLGAEAKAQHAPLRLLRVRLVWARMLRRAGYASEAAHELRSCTRLAAAAPPLLRRAVERERSAPPPAGQAAIDISHAVYTIDLLRGSQDEDDDRAAVQQALDRFVAQVRAARAELQSAAGGAVSSLVVSGTGIGPRLGQRAIETGIVVGPESCAGGVELAAPVRTGGRLLGAVACRWPAGRTVPGHASALVELTAAIVGPRAEGLLAARADAARASVAVPELIGSSAAMAEVRGAIARAATAPFAVLIEGESGAGKELVARAIHQLSPRRDRRFCDVNCAALPDDLVEAELFGHAKGAFTGALVERPGLFEEASGGTLFLDELPDLSLRAQAKLLRVLQQAEIRRLGEAFSRRVDVRLVTATNRSLADEVRAGRFRQDLLYRLDVIRIRIPPLRDRPEDIPLLARRFWSPAAERAGTRAVLSHAVLGELARYHWPGNVRELQNAIAALAVAAPSRGVVRPSLLPAAITGATKVSSCRLFDARRQFERRFIEVALARAGGSRTRAAQQLGVSRQGLLKLMARLGISA